MATSETEICSNALNYLGEQTITSLTDGTIRATLCATHYPTLRDALLSSHPWKFAAVRTSLATLAAAPAFEWTIAYQLPSDYLRMIETDPVQLDYDLDGATLVCDETAVKIRYIARVTDVTKFSPLFTMGLQYLLASELAPVLKVDGAMTKMMAELGNEWLVRAKIADAQNQATQPVDADDLITVRYLA
ncbi:major capsid protein [Caudoviricetes sp.]|nr:major capsid protein [Caudoviricetes sp.]UOF79641.1 major capsid protein [Caudoviricetes sp.]UOF79836.1 major capsid protein [Bacteriophage sp.]UOF81312.1 major capsid protein [Caudoviricetes sp.]